MAADVPVLAGSDEPLAGGKAALKLAEKLGYPVLLKAAHGGGGRGMRVVNNPDELPASLEQAQRESQAAFGSSEVFLEKFIARPRHIEVQLMGDKHGNLVHLFERDCSVQRRYQKVVEIAPALNLDPSVRDEICQSALRIGNSVRYESAGTVEFLLDTDTNKYLFHRGESADSGRAHRDRSGDRRRHRQKPDPGGPGAAARRSGDRARQSGRKSARRASPCNAASRPKMPKTAFCPTMAGSPTIARRGGLGIRLDAGTRFLRRVVTPYYDSLLVKVTAWARTFPDAARRMERRAAGVPHSRREDQHPVSGQPGHASPFRRRRLHHQIHRRHAGVVQFKARQDRATKLFNYLAGVIVNGHPHVKNPGPHVRHEPAPLPKLDRLSPLPPGTRDKLQGAGARSVLPLGQKEKRLLITDTTLRDAHQSLLGHPRAHVRHAGDRRLLRPAERRSCSRSRCGAERRSTRRCGS